MTPIVERQNQCKWILSPFSLWIIQVFALLFGAREPDRIIRKVENVEVYWAGAKERWPLSWATKTSLWRRREPAKQSSSTPADQHRRRSSTCKNSGPVKPTLFAHREEPWEPPHPATPPKKTFILACGALGLRGGRNRRGRDACLIHYKFSEFFFFHPGLVKLLELIYKLKTGFVFFSSGQFSSFAGSN